MFTRPINGNVYMNKIYITVWKDGYICNVIFKNNRWHLIGNKHSFESLNNLEKYYNGKIVSKTLVNQYKE